MVTFADLMALLFALFVLLLSFAEVDSDSFRKNAGPMRDAFGMGDKVMRTTSLPSIQQGESGPGQGPVPDPGSDQPDGRNRPVRPAHEGEKKLSLAVQRDPRT